MLGCLQKEVTGSVQKKNGYLYLSLNMYIDGKRKPRMINTGLSVKGYHQREADSRLVHALEMLNAGRELEEVKDAVQGEAFKKKPVSEDPSAKAIPLAFMRPELVDELQIETPRRTNSTVIHDLSASTIFGGEKTHRIRRVDGSSDGSLIQVSEYFKHWIQLPHRRLDKGTLKNYRRHVELRIVPYFDFFDVTLTELQIYDVTMFYEYCLKAGRLDKCGGDVSPSTINRVHSVMHLALNDAIKRGLIQFNPATDADAPQNNDFKPNVYTVSQVNAFLQAAVGDILAIPCIMLFCLGLRRGETLGIKESVVHLDELQVEIRHQVVMDGSRVIGKDYLKTAKSHRVLPISSAMAAALKTQLNRNMRLRRAFGPNWNPEGYLFTYDDGRVIQPNYFTKHFKSIAVKAGLPPIRLHDSRHTNITIGMKVGNNTKLMQAHSGHANIEMTAEYTHWDVQDLTKITDSIAKVLVIPQMNDYAN